MEKLQKTADKIALEVVKHTEVLKEIVTKKELAEFKNENFTRLDNMMTILGRLDQERVFTVERIRRIEEEIDKIKAHLAI